MNGIPPTVQLRAAALSWTPPPQAGEENGAEIFSLVYPQVREENGAEHVSFLPRLRGRCRARRFDGRDGGGHV
jgi:hypothetical protein